MPRKNPHAERLPQLDRPPGAAAPLPGSLRGHREPEYSARAEATGRVRPRRAVLRARDESYVVVNPVVLSRVHDARQPSPEKTDRTDPEQIAELLRTVLVTQTQLESQPYQALRRAPCEYRRLRYERARLKGPGGPPAPWPVPRIGGVWAICRHRQPWPRCEPAWRPRRSGLSFSNFVTPGRAIGVAL